MGNSVGLNPFMLDSIFHLSQGGMGEADSEAIDLAGYPCYVY